MPPGDSLVIGTPSSSRKRERPEGSVPQSQGKPGWLRPEQDAELRAKGQVLGHDGGPRTKKGAEGSPIVEKLSEEAGFRGPGDARMTRQRERSRWKSLFPREPDRRYERAVAGELLHLDIKKLGRIVGGPGHRVTGDRRGHREGSGWECAHVCVDDHSRLSYVEILPDEKRETTSAFLQRALQWYALQGVTPQALLTDNGSAYRSFLFAETCRQRGLHHLFTRPYRPRTNGKAERFIRTALTEWAYRRPFRSSAERARALQPWLHHYNFH